MNPTTINPQPAGSYANQSIGAQTVSNALSGEKSFRSVNFPATGDWESELILVVEAYLELVRGGIFPTEPDGRINFRVLHRTASVLEFLARRYRDYIEASQEAERSYQAQSEVGQSSQIGQAWDGLPGPSTSAVTNAYGGNSLGDLIRRLGDIKTPDSSPNQCKP